MSGIRARVGPPDPRGALVPAYDEEAGLLVAGTAIVEDWPLGINLDSIIICDLGADRMLVNFDFLIGREHWPIGPELHWPMSTYPGTIVFTDDAVSTENFTLPLEVLLNGDQTILLLGFGNEPTDRWIQLSEACLASVNGEALTGFMLRLEPNHPGEPFDPPRGSALSYHLDPGWATRADETDFRLLDETELRYYEFLGDVRWSADGADLGTHLGWVPLLDFGSCLLAIARALVPGGVEVFEFTESEATIEFAREGDSVRIRPSYAEASAVVSHNELLGSAERLLALMLDDFGARFPTLNENAWIQTLRGSLPHPPQ